MASAEKGFSIPSVPLGGPTMVENVLALPGLWFPILIAMESLPFRKNGVRSACGLGNKRRLAKEEVHAATHAKQRRGEIEREGGKQEGEISPS